MKSQSDVRNRRSNARSRTRRSLKMECRKGSLGLGPNLACECLDVSERGVRGVVKAALDVGSEVEVVLVGVGAPPVKRLANVCWSTVLTDERYSVGLRFQRPITHREVLALSAPSG